MREEAPAFTRLVFGVPAGASPSRELMATADIARWLGLELAAMMIEDEAVAALGAHPGAVLLSAAGRTPAIQMAAAIEREMRAATARFRRQLEQAATRASLHWSFEAVRGTPETVITGLLRRTDIVVYCEPATSLEREALPERALWQAVERSPAAVLYRPSRALPAGAGVMAFCPSEDAADPVNQVAGRLAAASGEPLLRRMPDGDWREIAAAWGRRPPRLIVLARGTMGLTDSDTIARAARILRVPLLVLDGHPGTA